jgi:acyl carrier protein
MNIEISIKEFIKGHFLKEGREEPIENCTSFIEEGIIDSVGVLELVAFIEETFGFRVEDEELVPENLDSLRKLVDYVQMKMDIGKAQASQ